MSIADIEKVRAAESEAEAIRKKAEDDMAQIIAAGRKEAKELLEKAEKDAETSYRNALDKAEAKATDKYNKTIAEQEAVCDKIRTEGRSRLDGVIDDIVGKVVGI